ncbi:MAG: hypothetical protein L3K05_00365, partial [Thermoplasmata archaeon]|nr:hypothetical protein [Thermoplasmata archaeon]
MEAITSPVPPSAVSRPYARAVVAIALVFIMLLSGLSVGFVLGSGARNAANPTGVAPMKATSAIQSGPQLQNDSFLQNPGTPLTSLQN